MKVHFKQVNFARLTQNAMQDRFAIANRFDRLEIVAGDQRPIRPRV